MKNSSSLRFAFCTEFVSYWIGQMSPSLNDYKSMTHPFTTTNILHVEYEVEMFDRMVDPQLREMERCKLHAY